MTTATKETKQSITYSPATIRRAERALICSGFQLKLFVAMRNQSVPMQSIAEQAGIKQGYTLNSISEGSADFALGWLITVGLLRREVDGQGITDSFRLTPLGRQIVEKWASQGGQLPSPSIWDRICDFLNHWLRLPL
jgi:hypothetical protein